MINFDMQEGKVLPLPSQRTLTV